MTKRDFVVLLFLVALAAVRGEPDGCYVQFCGRKEAVAGGASFALYGDVDADDDTDVIALYEQGGILEWHEYEGDNPVATHRVDEGITEGGKVSIVLKGRDIVVASSIETFLRIYEWPEWTPPRLIPTSSVSDLAAGDVDGDGEADLVIASTGGLYYWVSKNLNDDGNNATTLFQIDASDARAVAVAEVQDDGQRRLDVVSATYTTIQYHRNDDGAGGLNWTSTLVDSDAPNVQSLVFADVDSDGAVDVVASLLLLQAIVVYRQTVEVEGIEETTLWDDGSVVTNKAEGVRDLALLDVDFDGVYEIASTWTDAVAVHALNGAIIAFIPGIEAPLSVDATVNFNGIRTTTGYDLIVASLDGVEQVLCGGGGGGDGASQRPSPQPAPAPTYAVSTDICREELHVTDAAYGAATLKAGDVDGDSDLDLVVGAWVSGRLSWFRRLDDSTWVEELIDSEASRVEWLALADLDNDSDLDVAAALHGYGVAIYLQQNLLDIAHIPNAWIRHDIAQVNGIFKIHAADVDGDHDVDILTASTADDEVTWLENNNDWAVHLVTDQALGARSVYAADLDGDFDLDVLSASKNDNAIAIYENVHGNATTFRRTVLDTDSQNARDVTAADVDGDADLDVVSASPTDETVAVFFNDDGRFGAFHKVIVSSVADGATDVVALDVDGDARAEIFSAWFDVGVVAVHRLLGDHHQEEEEEEGDQQQHRSHDHSWETSVLSTAVTGARAVDVALVGGGGFEVYAAADKADTVFSFADCLAPTPAPTTAAPSLSFAPTAPRDAFRTGTACDATTLIAADDLAASSSSSKKINALLHLKDDNSSAYVVGTDNEVVRISSDDDDHDDATVVVVVDSSAGQVSGLSAADVDGDGVVDVVSASSSRSVVAWYACGTAAVVSCAKRVIDSQASGVRSVEAIDLDGDGDVDVLAALLFETVWYERIGEDDAGLPSFERRLLDSSPATVARTMDVDADSTLDVVVGSGDEISWHRQTPGSSDWRRHVVTANCADVGAVLPLSGVLLLAACDGDLRLYERRGNPLSPWHETTVASIVATAIAAIADPLDEATTLLFSATSRFVSMHVPRHDGGYDTVLVADVGAEDLLVVEDGQGFDVVVAADDALLKTDCDPSSGGVKTTTTTNGKKTKKEDLTTHPGMIFLYVLLGVVCVVAGVLAAKLALNDDTRGGDARATGEKAIWAQERRADGNAGNAGFEMVNDPRHHASDTDQLVLEDVDITEADDDDDDDDDIATSNPIH